MSFSVGTRVRLLVNMYKKRLHEGDEGEVVRADSQRSFVDFGPQYDTVHKIDSDLLEKASEVSEGT